MLGSILDMNDTPQSTEMNDGLAAPAPPREPAPPIHSRFLFVDVAALRAKQLRRGARLRFDEADIVHVPKKAERLAMEEVRRGLVQYDVPPPRDGGHAEEGL
jgi:DNA-directed RNA polymerase subunit K/omega